MPLPVPVEVAWDFMTDPLKRLMWQKQMTSIEPQTPGRIFVGSVNHCMHGPDLIVEHVADWRPFSYYTTHYPMEHLGDGQFWRHTLEFKQTDSGPIMILRTKSVGAAVAQWFEHYQDDWVAMMDANVESLQATVAARGQRGWS